MSIDTKGLILAGGIGAAALMLLSRKEDDAFGGMGEFWGGGGGSRETVTTIEERPTDTVTPTIVLPPVEPYQVNTTIPEWLFSRPAPVSGGGGGGDDAVDIVALTKKQAAISTEPPENVGAGNGFGGGGVGGRGADEDEGVLGLLGGIVSSAFNPVNLFLSATPFGGVAGVLGVATKAAPVFEAVTKKEAAVANNAPPSETASGSNAGVAGAGYTAFGATKKAVSVPSDDVIPFFTAGANYGAAKAVGQSSAGTVYQHSGGARSVVSQGQIVASSSRALDSADIARLPKKTAAVLGY